jgi:hypothetical protein
MVQRRVCATSLRTEPRWPADFRSIPSPRKNRHLERKSLILHFRAVHECALGCTNFLARVAADMATKSGRVRVPEEIQRNRRAPWLYSGGLRLVGVPSVRFGGSNPAHPDRVRADHFARTSRRTCIFPLQTRTLRKSPALRQVADPRPGNYGNLRSPVLRSTVKGTSLSVIRSHPNPCSSFPRISAIRTPSAESRAVCHACPSAPHASSA